MILLRHILLENSAVLYPGSQHLTRIVDASMLGIIILSAALILMARRRIAGISVVLFVCSAFWSMCSYWFITALHLPHVWPLCVILLLSGLTALYFTRRDYSFVLPLWLTLPVASWVLNDGLNLRFVTIWSVFTLIMLCGRFILLSWFDEAAAESAKPAVDLRARCAGAPGSAHQNRQSPDDGSGAGECR